ncbi:hypothetical protein XBO1_1570011 [Xenorhabdus bovienii str. oregonense]|uniref:Uncharacterized protein n=1 Tax=Xenorhabdus bovienii str. oregonense TaxID=1398202 RepID=A0A077P1H9_XENBV|nr:hypothetical protein XBO1_1570011 [Xenorhabdus bovienii str. oregonense]
MLKMHSEAVKTVVDFQGVFVLKITHKCFLYT